MLRPVGIRALEDKTTKVKAGEALKRWCTVLRWADERFDNPCDCRRGFGRDQGGCEVKGGTPCVEEALLEVASYLYRCQAKAREFAVPYGALPHSGKLSDGRCDQTSLENAVGKGVQQRSSSQRSPCRDQRLP